VLKETLEHFQHHAIVIHYENAPPEVFSAVIGIGVRYRQLEKYLVTMSWSVITMSYASIVRSLVVVWIIGFGNMCGK